MSILTKNIRRAASGRTIRKDDAKEPPSSISVADELEDQEVWDRVYDVWWAFCSTCRDLDAWADENDTEATPEQYGVLVDEFSDLLKAAFGGGTEKGVGRALFERATALKEHYDSLLTDNQKGSDSMSDEKTQGELEKEVTPDESKTAADPTTNETEATTKETDATTEKAVTTEDFAALLKTVVSLGEAVKTLTEAKTAEPVEKTAPVSDEETSRKELEAARDTAIADVAAKRAELETLASTVETLEQKARDKNAEYEAIVQRVLPTPDATKDDVVVDPSKLAGLFTDAETPQVSDKTFVGMSDEAILNS